MGRGGCRTHDAMRLTVADIPFFFIASICLNLFLSNCTVFNIVYSGSKKKKKNQGSKLPETNHWKRSTRHKTPKTWHLKQNNGNISTVLSRWCWRGGGPGICLAEAKFMGWSLQRWRRGKWQEEMTKADVMWQSSIRHMAVPKGPLAYDKPFNQNANLPPFIGCHLIQPKPGCRSLPSILTRSVPRAEARPYVLGRRQGPKRWSGLGRLWWCIPMPSGQQCLAEQLHQERDSKVWAYGERLGDYQALTNSNWQCEIQVV